jgi:hypothetical protein
MTTIKVPFANQEEARIQSPNLRSLRYLLFNRIVPARSLFDNDRASSPAPMKSVVPANRLENWKTER